MGRGCATRVTRRWVTLPYIGSVMPRTWWLPLIGLVACHPDPQVRRAPARHTVDTTLARMLHAPREILRDRALTTPRVISEPSVVVFWLPSTDTLSQDSAEAASRDLDFYTEQVAPKLNDNQIALIPTNVDTVYVELPGHSRRAIVLSGLDYPYGYLLIDPGTPERILTGVYDDDELLDEINAYFDLSDEPDSSRVLPRAVT
jgi:hypothetical protein